MANQSLKHQLLTVTPEDDWQHHRSSSLEVSIISNCSSQVESVLLIDVAYSCVFVLIKQDMSVVDVLIV